MLVTGAERCKPTRRRFRLPLVIPAPADQLIEHAQGATKILARADCPKPAVGRVNPAAAGASPADHFANLAQRTRVLLAGRNGEEAPLRRVERATMVVLAAPARELPGGPQSAGVAVGSADCRVTPRWRIQLTVVVLAPTRKLRVEPECASVRARDGQGHESAFWRPSRDPSRSAPVRASPAVDQAVFIERTVHRAARID